ncbi:MAG: hypothetical protein AAGJ35_08745 [Myxococcota bacterium]
MRRVFASFVHLRMFFVVMLVWISGLTHLTVEYVIDRVHRIVCEGNARPQLQRLVSMRPVLLDAP